VYVRACPNCSGHDYIDEWYDGDGGSGTTDCSQAILVPITGGQTTSGIDFILEYPLFIDIISNHSPDNTFSSWYGIYFFNFQNFDLDKVVSITMKDPSGTPRYHYTRTDGDQDDFVRNQWHGFHVNVVEDPPPLGEYTFDVVTDDFTTTARKTRPCRSWMLPPCPRVTMN
jgi:hypothetical protein